MVAVFLVLILLTILASSLFITSKTTTTVVKQNQENQEIRERLQKEMLKLLFYVQKRYIDPTANGQKIPFSDETNFLGLFTTSTGCDGTNYSTVQCNPLVTSPNNIVKVQFAANSTRKAWMTSNLGSGCYLNDDSGSCGTPAYDYYIRVPKLAPSKTEMATWDTHTEKVNNDNNVVLAYSFVIIDADSNPTSKVNGIEAVVVYHLKCTLNCTGTAVGANTPIYNKARNDKWYVAAQRYVSKLVTPTSTQ